MKKLSARETKKLFGGNLTRDGKGIMLGKIRLAALKLKINESILFTIKEWPYSTAPATLLLQALRKTRTKRKYSVRLIVRNKKWAICRIK